MNAPAVIPDCTRIEREDADTLASAIVRHLACVGGRLMLWLFPDGVVKIRIDPVDGDERDHVESLVGCYDRNADAAKIRGDILALQREPIDDCKAIRP